MKVAILGSGPSAAFAVLACRSRGIEPEVISQNDGHADQSGAFFLHWLPEEFVAQNNVVPIEVEFVPLGTAEGYSTKQWGAVIPTSFPSHPRTEKMYSSVELMRVWYTLQVKIAKLAKGDIEKACQVYDLVFHTFPINVGDRRTVHFPVMDTRCHLKSSRILYNGTSDRWIRCTTAFGRMSFEYPVASINPLLEPAPIASHKFERHLLRDIPPGTEPMRAEERAFRNLIPIGRFATMDRKVLSHHAFGTVLSQLEGGAD